MLVIRKFWGTLSTLSSLRVAVVQRSVIPAVRMFVAMTFVNFQCSTSSGGQSMCSKGPVGFSSVSIFLKGAGELFKTTAFSKIV